MDTYRATNTLNGKFYIGSSVNFEWRKYQHLHSKETYPFQTDLRKNPEAFIWEVYTDNLDTNEHEVRLLKEFYFDVRCYNLNSCAERPPSQKGKTWWRNELTQKHKLCFEKPGGEGWEKGFLQKTRKKQSEAVSEERKKAQSERMLGVLNHFSKAIIAIEPDGTQRHFESGCEAVRELEMNHGNLSTYLKYDHALKQGKFKGWQFFYENR